MTDGFWVEDFSSDELDSCLGFAEFEDSTPTISLSPFLGSFSALGTSPTLLSFAIEEVSD